MGGLYFVKSDQQVDLLFGKKDIFFYIDLDANAGIDF